MPRWPWRVPLRSAAGGARTGDGGSAPRGVLDSQRGCTRHVSAECAYTDDTYACARGYLHAQSSKRVRSLAFSTLPLLSPHSHAYIGFVTSTRLSIRAWSRGARRGRCANKSAAAGAPARSGIRTVAPTGRHCRRQCRRYRSASASSVTMSRTSCRRRARSSTPPPLLSPLSPSPLPRTLSTSTVVSVACRPASDASTRSGHCGLRAASDTASTAPAAVSSRRAMCRRRRCDHARESRCYCCRRCCCRRRCSGHCRQQRRYRPC